MKSALIRACEPANHRFEFDARPCKKKKIITLRVVLPILAAAVILIFLASCITPSPLYGTWADNKGNAFSFFNDDTFSARVSRMGITQIFEGNYTVLMNVLTLDCLNVELRVVTEWDIRGNILYLDWTSSEDESMSMTLFKISN